MLRGKEMRIQVLVAAMNQKDHSLIKKMNIRTDAIVGNQCSFNSVEKFNIGDQQIQYLNFAERGVGLNRNNALMRADADVCLFADDDMVYEDNYVDFIYSLSVSPIFQNIVLTEGIPGSGKTTAVYN